VSLLESSGRSVVVFVYDDTVSQVVDWKSIPL